MLFTQSSLAAAIALVSATVMVRAAQEPWALGMNITIMSATDIIEDLSTKCPDTLSAARLDSANWTPIQADTSKGLVTAGQPNDAGNAALVETFRLTNGVVFNASAPRNQSTSGATHIRVADATGTFTNLCWFRNNDTMGVGLGQCGSEFPDQAFFVSLMSNGNGATSVIDTFYLNTTTVADFAGPPVKTDRVRFGPFVRVFVCIYNAASGALLSTPTEETAAHVPGVVRPVETSTN